MANHRLKVSLLLFNPALNLIYSFTQLAYVVLDLPLKQLIYLGYQLLFVGGNGILLLDHLFMINNRALLVDLSLQWHNHDLKIFFR